jgi:hypothetical protein
MIRGGADPRGASAGLLGLRRPVPDPPVRGRGRGGRSPCFSRGLRSSDRHRGDTSHPWRHRCLRDDDARHPRHTRGGLRGRDTDPRAPALQLLAAATPRCYLLPRPPSGSREDALDMVNLNCLPAALFRLPLGAEEPSVALSIELTYCIRIGA